MALSNQIYGRMPLSNNCITTVAISKIIHVSHHDYYNGGKYSVAAGFFSVTDVTFE